MYSQCPECLTRFRVTASALRAAHGTVRCGRCGSAFDALPRLSDTLQDAGPATDRVEPVSPDATGAGGMAGATAAGLLAGGEAGSVPEFHFSADDIEQVFVDARDWQSRFGASPSPGDRAGLMSDAHSVELVGFLKEGETGEEEEPERDTNDPPVWVHEPESVEDITLEGERIQIEGIEGFSGFEEDFLEREIEREIDEQHRAEITGSHRSLAGSSIAVEPAVEAEPAGTPPIVAESTAQPVPIATLPTAIAAAATVLAVEPVTSVGSAPAAAPRAATPEVARWRRPTEPAREDSFDPSDPEHRLDEELATAADDAGTRWVWGVGALVLGLLLAVQLTHHYRLQLARDATLGPGLREVYARLGRPLPPNWNLAAFTLRQWGANESAPAPSGTMSVRASLKNGAAFAQPMPLLRLELEDRFGGTVARRDFQPAEYLKDPATATRLLPAGSSTEAELTLAGTTPEAVGYRLDVCLRDESGTVRCAEAAGASPSSSQAPQ